MKWIRNGILGALALAILVFVISTILVYWPASGGTSQSPIEEDFASPTSDAQSSPSAKR